MLSRTAVVFLRQLFPLSLFGLLTAWATLPSPIQSSAKAVEPEITTGALNLAREGHTATLLQNGKVFVAGGRNGTTIYNSAEIYDPSTGAWSATPNFTTARYGHSAVLLRNGQVMLIGGQSTSALEAVEIYDPVDNTWKSTLSSKLNTARARFTATLLNTGRVLVAGGLNASGALRSAELYDPVTRVWAPLSNLTDARAEHTATLLNDGRVLVAGGANGSTSVKTAELFEPSTNRWRRANDLLTPRRQHTATRLADGSVLVAGGANGTLGLNTVEIYNATVGRWSATGTLTIGRRAHTATLLPNGQVLVAGGVEPGGKTLDSAESYDLIKRDWANATQGPPFTSQAFVLVDGRSEHTATLLPNGKVLFSGGLSTSNLPLKSTELHEYAIGGWALTRNLANNTTTQMLGERAHHTATLLPNGKVLVAGGAIVAATAQMALATAELFDPSNGTWTTTGALSSARYNHTATLLPNGRVLIVGGQTAQVVFDNAEIYDPVTGIWTKGPAAGMARYAHTATLLQNGRVLIAGGIGGNGQPLRSAQLFDPTAGTTGGWTNIQDLPQARANHSATFLPDGTIFLFGGKTLDNQLLNNAVLLTANGWTTRNFNNPPFYRWGHTATLLPNNRLLIAGGQGGKTPSEVNGALTVAEVYNHAAGVFEASQPNTGNRIEHTATLLPNGKVLLAGGRVIGVPGTPTCPNPGATPAAVLFDPSVAAGSPTSVVQLANPLQMRNSQTATLLPNGQALLAGGLSQQVLPNCTFTTLRHSELFDVGLGYLEEWRPALAFVATTPNQTTLAGVQFQGVSEAGGDGAASSASNYPLAQLLSLGNEQVMLIPPTTWSNNLFTYNPVSNFAPGLALLTVYSNGIPSNARVVTNGGGNFGLPNAAPLGTISGRVILHNIAAPLASISIAPVSGSPRECNTAQTVRTSPTGEFNFRELVVTPDQGRNFCRYLVTPIAEGISFFPRSAIFTMIAEGGSAAELLDKLAEPAQTGLTCLNCINNVFVSSGPSWNLAGNVQRSNGAGVSEVTLEFSVPYEIFDDRLTCEDASGNAVPCTGGARTINADVCAKVSSNPLITDANFKCACTTLRSDGVCEKTVLARYSMPVGGSFNVANVPNGANAVVTPFNLPAGTQYTYSVQPLAPPGAAPESFIRIDQVAQNYDNLLITANAGCTFSLAATAVAVPVGGGTGSVNVTANGGQCAWSAASNSSWLTVTSGGSGTGNGTVNFTAAANNNAAARAGTLTIAGLVFTVTQPGNTATPAVINVSAASFFADRQAPESIVAAFGAKLATGQASATTLPLPDLLAGTIVNVRDSAGATRRAQLFFVAPTQVNFLLPPDSAQGMATVTITTGDGVVSAGQLQVERIGPGVFSANANGTGVPAAVLLRIAANGTQTYETIAKFDNALGRYVPQPISLGPTGEQVYLILFGTGIRRRVNLASVTGTVDGLSTPIGFAQAQGSLIGTDQVNLGPLPRALVGRGNVNVILNVEGRNTNPLVIAVQ